MRLVNAVFSVALLVPPPRLMLMILAPALWQFCAALTSVEA